MIIYDGSLDPHCKNGATITESECKWIYLNGDHRHMIHPEIINFKYFLVFIAIKNNIVCVCRKKNGYITRISCDKCIVYLETLFVFSSHENMKTLIVDKLVSDSHRQETIYRFDMPFIERDPLTSLVSFLTMNKYVPGLADYGQVISAKKNEYILPLISKDRLHDLKITTYR